MKQLNPNILLVSSLKLDQFFSLKDNHYFQSESDGTSIQTIIFDHPYQGKDLDYHDSYSYSEENLISYTEIIVQDLAEMNISPVSNTPFIWINRDNRSILIRENDNPDNPQIYMEITFHFTDAMAYITIVDYFQ